ncbi:hypothetical protein D8B26_002878 [Coccidioides posadasii str. Silveira]|uniref:COX assembly mitochondrial protein n=3 Tax=Coccidioides posadasii TaxID=199306 RepID=E9CXY2_COCPS|nr:hypothetical protein CPC735_008900 [Coccidioides posadasii C735 delta SOWgp]EER26715.1 hypothetical protein CPC735_008900 [Coccidioides posadasii C735 delta SOWgp]EFW20809.1 conserved hypothetical protein [Coccidioides posadasii str. Silveira]KMM72632.1 hypothetical protein CPAG_08925 [Coccidioides posadasii RMSCC 3488]QVM08185.1 hypothetical protein D8B26_002878 [Coccidioides posadasii str. Silveira]|eukprot:XP_003068860.1 hypothetical protein CPC735_008900 [Coccidioides posadasii C735 delta SOWgp]
MMAAATSSPETASNPPPGSAPSTINLRNPTPLSATQEAEVKAIYYKRVRGYCAAEIKEFAACALNRTVTATWVCRKERLAMNACMVEHAKPEEEDRAREEWFAGREERRKAREHEDRMVEERRKEVIAMMREGEKRRKAETGEQKAADGGSGGWLAWGKR